MEELLERLQEAVEYGKINKDSPYPPQMNGKEGSYELTAAALAAGLGPDRILEGALIPAMEAVGERFAANKIFVPQMLISAKAMGASMKLLQPFIISGEVKSKGTFLIGTVKGDLHDIGKNLVAMMIEGAGWKVIDLGVDVCSEKFLKAINENPGSVVGMSSLLTTTMVSMKETVKEIKNLYPEIKILIGGAPVTLEFCKAIGADFYSADPQGAVIYLKSMAAN